MMMFDTNKREVLDDVFSNEDSLFHYSSRCSGVQILSSNKIRLSNRKKSNDPIENINLSESYLWFSKNDIDGNQIYDDSENLNIFIRNLKVQFSNSKQLCFCKNFINQDKSKIELGFLKPRMWDNYGDKYNGVCLVFSKRKLIDDLEEKINGDVNYIDYSEFSEFKFEENLNKYLENPKKYIDDIKEKFKKRLFSKHIDYNGENEFRIISFSDREYDYIPIKNSLIGVIVSTVNNSDLNLDFYKQYQKSENVPLYLLNWKELDFTFNPI